MVVLDMLRHHKELRRFGHFVVLDHTVLLMHRNVKQPEQLCLVGVYQNTRSLVQYLDISNHFVQLFAVDHHIDGFLVKVVLVNCICRYGYRKMLLLMALKVFCHKELVVFHRSCLDKNLEAFCCHIGLGLFQDQVWVGTVLFHFEGRLQGQVIYLVVVRLRHQVIYQMVEQWQGQVIYRLVVRWQNQVIYPGLV